MKRRCKKKHRSSDTSSGYCSEEVIEDRNESFGDPTSQKQTQAESEDETSDEEIPDKFMGMDLHPRILWSAPRYTDFMMPRTKPDYDDMKPRSQSLPYSAEFYESELLETQTILGELTSSPERRTKPVSDQELRGQEEEEASPVKHGGMVLRGSYPDLLTYEDLRQKFNRQVKPSSMKISQKNSTMPLYDQRAKFERSEFPDPPPPLGLLSSYSLPKYQGPTPSPLIDHCYSLISLRALKTKPEERENMAGIFSRAEPACFSLPTKDFQEKLKFTQGTSSTFRHRPNTIVSKPKQVSLPLKSNISKAVTKSGRSRSLSSPPSSSPSIHLSVADPQFSECINTRLKRLEGASGVQRESESASDQEFRGQEKREEENPPVSSSSLYGGFGVSAVGTHPGLPSGSSLQQHQVQTPYSLTGPYYPYPLYSSPLFSPLDHHCDVSSPKQPSSMPSTLRKANPYSTPGYRRNFISYQGPELPKTLSLHSTKQLKPDDTNMEQKRSALIQHPHAQFSAPTPEHINTETQEEAASGSGSLSVSEGTEPVLYEDPGPDQDLLEADLPILAELLSDTKALPPSSDVQFCSTDSCLTKRTSSSVPGSVSMPSLNHITSAGNNKPTRAASLPDLKLQSSFEEFTPDVSEDHEDHEGYRFQCSCPGLYQCSVTGLVFDMEGEGDVLYRTVPWNRRLLVQHHKKPAGPLFDIKCQQQSVRQLHLPHCQILPTAGFLAVAHVKDDGVEFITPHKITETHLVINIRGFSGFGNVEDEDSPPDPIRALVLLFYRPPDDSDFTSELSVLFLPRNIVIRDVQRTRRKLVGDERFINVSPHCKLVPDQVYTLSTEPEDDLIKVQPTEAEFDEDSYDNYFPSIVVSLKTLIRDISLSLKDKTTSCCVWERDVCLLPSRAKPLTLPPKEKLLNIWSSFINRTSGPVLNDLLDKLLEKKVFNYTEREKAHEKQIRRDKADFIIDTVRKKGDAASSEMIKFFCELDPFLSKDLELNSVQKDEMEQG